MIDERNQRMKAQVDRFKRLINLVSAVPDAYAKVEFLDLMERQEELRAEDELIDNNDTSDENVDVIVALGEKKIQLYEEYLKRINEYMENNK